MDGTGVRGILSIYGDTDSVVGMVQVSTELTTHRKNNGFMGNFKHSCNFTAVLIFCDFMEMSNPCTESTAEMELTYLSPCFENVPKSEQNTGFI